MVALSAIKTQLRTNHGRGSSIDGELDGFIRQAVRYIERRQSFDYMYKWYTFQLDPNSQLPRTIKLNANEVKSIDFIRIVLESGKYHYIKRKQPDNVEAEVRGLPCTYWPVQENLLILDAIPDRDWKVEICFYEFSTVETGDNWTHWLFNNFEEGLIAKTMSLVFKRFRDEPAAARELAFFEDQFSTLVMTEEEKNGSNADFVMTNAE